MFLQISDNSMAIWKLRYLEAGETIEERLRAVAGGNEKFYRLMVDRKFLPNSPTIFNMGRNNGCTSSACFTADTVIHTLEGDFTVQELLAKNKQQFLVYSTDGEKLRIGEAFALRKTRTNAKVYRVTFDTGESIKLTDDHLVMMRNGSYKEVRQLHIGDSIMPFNYSYWNLKGGKRRLVCPNISGRKMMAYRWAYLEVHGVNSCSKTDIHHKNGNSLDDRPENLELLTNAQHASLHISEDNPMHRPEVAAKISKGMKGNKRGVGPKPGTAKAMLGNKHAQGTVWSEERRKAQSERMKGKKIRAGKKWTEEERKKIMEGRAKARQNRDGANNHKVVSIEYTGHEDVYDLSVHKYHNFAANGVFIHNCFVFNVADNMRETADSIVATRDKAIAVAKAGGGVGYYFGFIRPKGSPIKSVQRVACGPVTVLRDYNAVEKLITQGGKRDLAQMGVLNVTHDDIEEFINCKNDNPQELKSFNISVSWDDQSLQQAFSDPHSRFADLWNKQVSSAWQTGCPGMLFFDAVNRTNYNKHLGLIYATNPCQPGMATVLTKEGIRRFDDIKVGSVIWSGQRWTEVINKTATGIKPVFRYVTNVGSFVGTEDHRVVSHGQKVRVADAKTIDACPKQSDGSIENNKSYEVVTREYLGDMPVYDITVDAEEHTYWTEGLLVSNCGETPNRSDEPCNLGSLNLARYFLNYNRSVDWDNLYLDAYTATEFLDDILDRNTFPHPDITRAALLTRKLGLGVMGWADLLALLHIHYDTDEAVELGGRTMRTIQEAAREASIAMARTKGPYAGFSDQSQMDCTRNETNTSVAPTGTIALLLDASSSIEPHYELEWERTTKEGVKLHERIPVWDHLDGFIPKTAMQIAPEWHIRHQAAFQKYTDLGVSKTINVPNNTTKEDVSKCYRLLYESGCKGGTIFRDGCRSEQVLVSKKGVSVFSTGLAARLSSATEEQQKQIEAILNGSLLTSVNSNDTRKLPTERQSITKRFKVGGVKCYMTVGLFDDGKPAEVFFRASKLGSTIGGLLDTWAVNFSLSLRRGVPLEDLCRHHIGARFEPLGMTDDPDIPVCSSIPDFAVRWLQMRFLGISKETSASQDSGLYCPECGKGLIYQSGCLICTDKSCGFSRCG